MQIILNKPFLLVMLVLLMATCANSTHEITKWNSIIPNLYSYNLNECRRILESLGIEKDFDEHIQRNAAGTEVHFFRGGQWKYENQILVIKQDGSHIITKGPKRPPNIPNEAVIDLSDRYCFMICDVYITNIVSIADTNKCIRLPIAGRSIFSKGDTIYLFGYDEESSERCPNESYFWCKKDKRIICYVIEDNGIEFLVKRVIKIDRPCSAPTLFYVEDVSPFTNDIFIIDQHDFPRKDKWYIYNLDTDRLNYIGPSKGEALFLVDDILKKFFESQKGNNEVTH